MDAIDTPVLDNHLHLDPEHGRGMDAVEAFVRVGGTHLLVVNKPSWQLGIEVEAPADFRAVFETTCDIVAAATERLPGRAWPVLGVHPTLISRLVDERGYEPEAAADLMAGGLDVAAEFVSAGRALAVKSGRPHYETTPEVTEASNRVLRHALSIGADQDCAVQLHTEATEDLSDVAEWAETAGLPPEMVVKHYAAGQLAGVTPSVMSDRDRLTRAAENGGPFLMETDFVDDPERPGAVLGPKTVPRRVTWLLEAGHTAAVRTAHVQTPATVYGIDTEATLDPAE
ncbi:MAG: TatD family hydrolase [Halobacteriaceae archaeon]